LKFFFEGEEEAGSPHLEALLAGNRERLRADLWLLLDGPVHQTRRMALYFGARGIIDLELTLYGPSRPLHSGHYGNWAVNPIAALARLLAGMRDEEGRITIDGFSEAVRPPTEAEVRAVAQAPPVEETLRRDLLLGRTEGSGASLSEGILLPAFNLRGIAGGRVGEGATNSIPTEATASIDIRLVPDLTPEKARERVEEHVRRQGYTVVHEEPTPEARVAHPRIARLVWGPGYPASRTPMDLPASRGVIRTVEEWNGSSVVKLPTLGGSVPMHLFSEILKSPVVGVPIVNHDNDQHAANENLRLQNLWDGIEVYAALMARLSALWEEPRP
ncbi:MAG: M20/M25/M40 family metallo-hydrolase, partial [Thermoanaerobaculia bacterium]